MPEPTVTFDDAIGVRSTSATLTVRLDGGREVDVPLAVIAGHSCVWAPGDIGRLIVAEWWAQKEGL